jgi:glutathione synthase/RimK-type ligase-like ATP-grasp enzyme
MAKITILVQSSGILSQDTIVLDQQNVVDKLNIPTNQALTLRFGSLRTQVRVVPVSTAGGLRISESLAYHYGLRHGTKLRTRYNAASQTLIIGPLLGVLVSRIRSDSPDAPFGSSTAFCKELTEACGNEGAFVYFFTAQGIASGNESIQGWFYHGGSWSQHAFPVPNVVYNRLTTRKLENKPSVQQFMKEVKSRYNTTIFNEKYLNKTEVFDALKKDPGLVLSLPESHLFRSYQQLKAMSERYQTVFIKPITGSLGKGIIRISRQSGQSYICHFSGVNTTRKQNYSSLPGVFRAISGKVKSRRYQIQQGLNLIRINSHPVDFRALVQRNERGEWAVTSIVARIAGNDHFVSNLARGGSLSKVKDALIRSNLSNARVRQTNNQLRAIALQIAAGIEAHIKGHFAELGIDLAVDASGKVWLLEVNSKPAKNDAPLSEDKIRPSVRQIVQYVRYLTGF